MRIAREGFPLISIAAVLTLLALAANGWFVAAVFGAVAIALAGFFRDPERVIPAGEGLVVSPADGRVVSIAKVVDDPFFTQAATRISIFLSPLTAHQSLLRGHRGDHIGRVSFSRLTKRSVALNEKRAIVDAQGRNGVQMPGRAQDCL
jgi:phosphatidylserine decarboxylase precursor-related protein